MIINIPSQIKRIENAKKKKLKNEKKQSDEMDEESQSETRNEKELKKNRAAVARKREQIDNKSVEKVTNEVKGKLIGIVSGYAQTHFKDCSVINKTQIKSFEKSDDPDFIFKCKFACPMCQKQLKVRYTKCWKATSVKTHFKMHENKAKKEKQNK